MRHGSSGADLNQEDDVRGLVYAAQTGCPVGSTLHLLTPGCRHSADLPGNLMTLLADPDPAELRRLLDINVVGTFLCMKYEIPRRPWSSTAPRS